MIFKKIYMIILMQKDLEKAVNFYEKFMKLIFHLEGKWAELELNNTKIGLCPTSIHYDNIRTGVVIQVNNINDTFNQLKKLNINFIREPFTALHGIMATFKDPGGNIIDIYQPTPEKIKEFIKKTKSNN